MPDHDESVRLYGPWLPRTPRDAAVLFEGCGGPWWIAGGWAIEAFTGVTRPHDDVDPSIPRPDVAALRAHLSGRLDVWQADDGILRPMVEEADTISDTCENLWLRPSGAEPWEYDVILMHTTSTTWTFKRDPCISLPLPEILWVSDGITYLRPEVQLLHKARALRPKDQADFEVCAPLLDLQSRTWLREALELAHPDHPWLGDLHPKAPGGYDLRMPEPELVRLDADGWTDFRDVRLASLADAPQAFGSRHADWFDATEDRWRARLTDVPFTVIARVDGHGVGVVSGVSSGEHVELISMWVSADQRGTGLAGRLIGSVVEWATSLGLGTELMVRDDNEPAIGAYQRAGFTDLGVPSDWPAIEPRERRMRYAGCGMIEA